METPERPAKNEEVATERATTGRDPELSAEVEGFDQLLALVEKLVCNCNMELAGTIEKWKSHWARPEEGKVESSLTIDSAGLIDNVRRADREQVSYMFYMAKADALNLLHETE